jgi:hypothetical protein
MAGFSTVHFIEIQTKSKSSPNKKPYLTVVDSNFRIGCDCRGWTTLKYEKDGVTMKVRECVHTKDMIRDYKLAVRVQNEQYQYVTNMDASGNVSGAVPFGSSGKPAPAPKAAPKAKAAPVRTTPTVDKYGVRIIDVAEDSGLDPYVEPMLAEKMPDLPDHKVPTVLKAISRYKASEWVIEEKYDGHRAIVAVFPGGVVKAWSRPRAGKDALVRDLPAHIVKQFAKLPVATYDGELYVPGGISTDVTDLRNAGKEVFVVFDILRLMGEDTTRLSQDERREFLTEIFDRDDYASDVLHLTKQEAPSRQFVEAIFARKGEGAILKRRKARYQPGSRSTDWIKVKGNETALLTVTGYEKGKLGPYATVCLMNPMDASTTRVKTLDNDALRAFAADPDSFIGRKLWIEYQFRTRDGGYRHPMWDRWESK